MAYDIHLGIRIAAPRTTVFPYLLTPHHLARWFCNFAQVQPTVGGSFRFGGDYCIVAHPKEGGAWETTIRAGEVLRRFGFTWPLWDHPTEVEFVVEDRDGGCLLRASHTGLPRDTSTCGSFLDAWRICLGNLKAIAEGREDSFRPDSSPVSHPEVKLDLLLHAPAARTFDAFSRPEELDRWAAKQARVGAGSGGDYILGWPGEAGHLVRWEPPRALAVRWAGIATSIEVEEKGASRSAVHLRLRDWPAKEEGLARAQRCLWSSRLVELKNYLEAGTTGFTEPRDEEVAAAGRAVA